MFLNKVSLLVGLAILLGSSDAYSPYGFPGYGANGEVNQMINDPGYLGPVSKPGDIEKGGGGGFNPYNVPPPGGYSVPNGGYFIPPQPPQGFPANYGNGPNQDEEYRLMNWKNNPVIYIPQNRTYINDYSYRPRPPKPGYQVGKKPKAGLFRRIGSYVKSFF